MRTQTEVLRGRPTRALIWQALVARAGKQPKEIQFGVIAQAVLGSALGIAFFASVNGLVAAIVLPLLIALTLLYDGHPGLFLGGAFEDTFSYVGFVHLSPLHPRAHRGVAGPRADLYIKNSYILPLFLALWFAPLALFSRSHRFPIALIAFFMAADPAYFDRETENTPRESLHLRIKHTALVALPYFLFFGPVAEPMAWAVALVVTVKLTHIALKGLDHWGVLPCEQGVWYYPDEVSDEQIEAWEAANGKYTWRDGDVIIHDKHNRLPAIPAQQRKASTSRKGARKFVPSGSAKFKHSYHPRDLSSSPEPEALYRGDEDEGLYQDEGLYREDEEDDGDALFNDDDRLYIRGNGLFLASSILTPPGPALDPLPPPAVLPRRTHPRQISGIPRHNSGPPSPTIRPAIPPSTYETTIQTLLTRLSSSTPPPLAELRLLLPQHIDLATTSRPALRTLWHRQLPGLSAPLARDLLRNVLEHELANHQNRLRNVRSGVWKPVRRAERERREKTERGVGGWRRVGGFDEGGLELGVGRGRDREEREGRKGRRGKGRDGRSRSRERERNRDRDRDRDTEREREYYVSVIEDEAARWPDAYPDRDQDADSASDTSAETDVYFLETRYPHNVIPRRRWAETFKDAARGEYGLAGRTAYWAAHLVVEALCWVAFIAFLSILSGGPFDIYNRGGGRWDVLLNAWGVARMVLAPVGWVLKKLFAVVGGEYFVAAWRGVGEAWEYAVTAGGRPVSLKGVLVDFPTYLLKVMLSRFLPWVGELLMNVWYSGQAMIGEDALRAVQEREAWIKERSFLWVPVIALAIVWTS